MSIDIHPNQKIQIENAVVYARYSSHSQGEQSIEGQLAKAHEFAANHGYNIIHEYIDRAQSGRTDHRTEFQQMLKDTAKKHFTVIICWKVDRFGRNREEIAINKTKCKKNGVRVEYVAETIPNTPEGVILESVLEGFAEYYSLQLSQNIRRGQQASIEKCQAIGKYPFGYTVNEQKHFIINEQTAPVVRMIFESYAQGYTSPEIAKMLNEKGIRTQTGKLFKTNSILTILNNERYTGVYIAGDYRKEGGMPQIISKELYDQVHLLMKKNKRAPANKWSRQDYILTDKLFCGKCGSPMVGECGTSGTKKKYNYYTCSARKKRNACDKKAVPKEWIEDFVLNAVTKLIFNDELLKYIAHTTYQYYTETQEETDRLDKYKADLRETEKSIANLLAVLKTGVSLPSVVEEIQNLEIQKSNLQRSIAEEEALQKTRLTEDQILFFLMKFRELDTSTRSGQIKLIQTFVHNIYVYDDEIILTFNYSENPKTKNKLTLSLIEQSQKFAHHPLSSTKTGTAELFSIFHIAEVVAVKFKIPMR